MLGVNWGTIKRTTDWGCSRYGADRPAGTRHQGKPTGQTARARRHPGPARRSRMLEWAAGAVNSRNRGEHPGTGPRRDDIQKRNDMTTDTELLSRITVRPDVFGGKPIIRDMRIAVEHVLGNARRGRLNGNDPVGVRLPRRGGHPGLPAVRPPLPGGRTGL